MRRIDLSWLAVVAVLGLGSTASAADLPYKAPPPILAPPAWSGFYLGLNAGGSIGWDSTSQSATFSSTALGANTLLTSSGRLAPTGWLAGAQIGYNWQVSPIWVLGLEADWQWSSQKDSANASSPATGTVAFFGAGANGFGYSMASEQKVTDIGTVRARGGAVVGNTLWYATGGFAWGTVKDSYNFLGSANPTIFPAPLQPGPFLPGSASSSHMRAGWTIGGGAETKLGGGWSAKLEYLYVDLGRFTDTFAIAINPAFGAAFTTGGVASAASTTHVTDNVVRLGLNYQFNR
jgi:outer membrane immunogenic protein